MLSSNTATSKMCWRCKQIFPLKNFFVAKKGFLGLSSWCRPCCSNSRKALSYPPAVEKKCRQCRPVKSGSEFTRSQRLKSGLGSYCRPCLKINRKKWYAAPEVKEKQKVSARKSKLKRVYGLDEKAFSALVALQGGQCAICGSIRPGGHNNQWHIDHDHQTKHVRGLLCAKCNMGIGQLKDDPATLVKAFFYLVGAQSAVPEVT